ncbi:hypothetical protein Scep_014560 [Stephania cephalantha]|uniref:DUF6821 domain-containing protein n=1 Tax=Stephania cephalantha TaxID=152367 RepID=A0AAP0J1G9_9MAGN
MDLDDWEILSNDGFLIDFHHYDRQDGIKKGLAPIKPQFDRNPNGTFHVDYFICPSQRTCQIIGAAESWSDLRSGNQVIPIPTQLDQKRRKSNEEEEKVKEVIKVPIVEINKFETSVELEKIKSQNLKSVGGGGSGGVGGDQDLLLSKVFFTKPKGSDVFDMKIDFPRAIKPQLDAGSIQFEKEKETDGLNGESNGQDIVSPKLRNDNEIMPNIWKWRINGIGTLCSMGVAAATIFIFILGSNEKHKHYRQKLKFQICATEDQKRIKQVVHHGSKLNQAFQAVRGVPDTIAQVTFGGYYEGL